MLGSEEAAGVDESQSAVRDGRTWQAAEEEKARQKILASELEKGNSMQSEKELEQDDWPDEIDDLETAPRRLRGQRLNLSSTG